MTGQTTAAVLAEFAGAGFGPFKEKLVEALVAHLAPINARAQALLADPAHLDSHPAIRRAACGGDCRPDCG